MRQLWWMRAAALMGLFAAVPAAAQAQAKALTVDATGEGAWVALGDEARVATVSDPRGSAEWDLAFLGTSVIVNGGEAGPGGVTAYCLCRNEDASNEAVQAMSPESELPAFDAVSASDVPSDAAVWHPAALATSPWYRYNLAGNHLIWPTYDVYLLRKGEDVYKVQIIGYYGEDGTPRQLTFRYQAL